MSSVEPPNSIATVASAIMLLMLMVIVSLSSFWVHELHLWGPWSPIHLLSIFTLLMLPLAVWAAHRHAVDYHRRAMTGIFLDGARESNRIRPENPAIKGGIFPPTSR